LRTYQTILKFFDQLLYSLIVSNIGYIVIVVGTNQLAVVKSG